MSSPMPIIDYFKSISRSVSMRNLLLGILVGLLSGFAAVGFFYGVEFAKFHLLHLYAGITMPAPAGEEIFHGPAGPVVRPWLIPIMTTLVGILTGWLVLHFIPETIGGGTDGTDAMINSFHNKKGQSGPLAAIVKGLTAILTIGTGGSAGREGPISQIGAAIGCFIANRLHFSDKDRRILLLSGAAGGLGAIFRAPLGGALTAIEVIYKEDFESEAVLPAVTSSVIAYCVFALFFGTSPIFGIPTFQFTSPIELPFYLILGIFCSLTGWLHVRIFEFLKFRIFERVAARTNLVVATGLGGLAMGIIGMLYPQVLTGGYGWLELAIKGHIIVTTMLGILIGKIIATALTIGSGMSGGMFAPALMVGGMSGGIIGQLAHRFFPHIVTQPGGYVLVGMAAFFASVANAPIGPLVMVCELTRGYGLLAPLMLASMVSILLGKSTSLYEHQVENKFESPAHLEDMTINVLESLPVDKYYHPGPVATLEEGTTLKALTDIITNSNALFFPVRNDKGAITGMLGVADLRQVIFENSLYDLIVVRDLAHKPVLLFPKDDLYTALLRFVDTNYAQIPVVDPSDPDKILGILNREDVFQAYRKSIAKITPDSDKKASVA